MRHHKGTTKCPKQKTPQAEDAHIPGNHHKHGGAAPDKRHCTRYVAVHPLWGGAPVMGRCTRTEEV